MNEQEKPIEQNQQKNVTSSNNDILLRLEKVSEKISKLESKFESKRKDIIITALVTLFSSMVLNFLTTEFNTKSRLIETKVQKQKQVYSELMGIKFTIMQYHVTILEAKTNFYYHYAKWKLNLSPRDSLHFPEAIRFQRKSEDMVFKIVDSNQALHEIIGAIFAYYPDSPKLRELINRIDKFGNIEVIGDSTKSKNSEQLDAWRTDTIKKARDMV